MLFFVFFNELKFRFFYCLSFFIVSFFFCFFFSKELIFIFVKPLLDINVKKINFSYFIFTEMSEVIYIYFYIFQMSFTMIRVLNFGTCFLMTSS